MKRAIRFFAFAAILFFVVIAGYRLSYDPAIPSSTPDSGLRTAYLDGHTIRVSVADTEGARARGLGGRPGLAPDEGMLFVFPADGEYAFWMKNMRFSIDILWISSDGKVVYMLEDVSPDTYPQSFRPDVPARYVLELPAGYAKEYTVQVGDVAQF